MKKERFLILAIFGLAVILRFYKLTVIPPGLYVDEAAIGYNSYSIASTGKDEYGKSFPVYFRSFGDYKMPLYIYLSAIPIKLFGLNVFSVRFLSALSGSLMIFVVYFLVKNLFPKEKRVAFLSALLLAILPWTVFLSRMALEMQLGLFFLLLALLFHQKALQGLRLRWWLSTGVLYALTSYAYHTEKFIAPLTFVVWSLVNLKKTEKKENFRQWKNFLLSAVLLMILLGPQIRLSFSSGANARISSLTYFKDRQNLPYNHRPLAVLRKWGAMYTAYFSPRNLFYDPDPDPQRSLPNLSVFYSWMVVPFLIGLYSFLKKETDLIGKRFILLFLVSPLPASLTKDPFSTFRAFPLVFPIAVLISLGISTMMSRISKGVLIIAGVSAFLFSLGLLWRSLFILLPNERFLDWDFGYEQLIQKIEENNYQKVLIDDFLGTSYIEALFFSKYNPRWLLSERKTDLTKYYQLTDWQKESVFGRYEIRPIYWEKDVYQKQLIVASPLAVSESQAKEHFFTKSFDIMGPDGKVIINGYLTNPELKIANNERKKNESRNN